MTNVECRMNRCHSERSRLPRRSFMRRREESRCGSLKIIPRDPSTSLRMTALVFIGRGKHELWIKIFFSGIQRAHAFPNRGRGFATQLLVGNRFGQRVERAQRNRWFDIISSRTRDQMTNVECRMNRCHSERSRLPRRSFMRRREESRCGSLKIIPRDPSTSLRMTALVFIGLTRPNLLGLVIGMETKLTW